MVDEEQVAKVIEDIRSALQAHGGDIKLVEVTEDGTVKVELQGACRGCPMAQMTIRRGVEARLKQEIPEVKEVVPVEPSAAAEGE
ncbi:MAG: NifU family protein [Planctomycetota bacterium]|jgi:Fe-S cluster biogenesis protein NfuA